MDNYEDHLKFSINKYPFLANQISYFIDKYGSIMITSKEVNKTVIYINNVLILYNLINKKLQSFNSGLDYNLIAENIMKIGYTYNVKSKNVYEKKTKKSNIFKPPEQINDTPSILSKVIFFLY